MSKRKNMEKLASRVEEKKNTVYFTENHPNAGNLYKLGCVQGTGGWIC